MFRTKFERIQVNTCPGDGIAPVRAGEYNAQHQIVVKEKGKEDLYSKINSYANSVNIHVLLKRFQNGDKEALMQRAGAFIDISALPTNLNEFVNMYKNGENLFNTLPKEVKEKFNNNMVEFIAKIGTSEWKEIMSASPADIKEEVLENDKKAQKAHKEAARVQFNNSVYGSDYDAPVEDSSKTESAGVDRRGVRNAL